MAKNTDSLGPKFGELTDHTLVTVSSSNVKYCQRGRITLCTHYSHHCSWMRDRPVKWGPANLNIHKLSIDTKRGFILSFSKACFYNWYVKHLQKYIMLKFLYFPNVTTSIINFKSCWTIQLCGVFNCFLHAWGNSLLKSEFIVTF